MLFRSSFARALAVALTLSLPPFAASADPPPAGAVRVSLVPYAALFSLQTKQPDLIDPFMFVASPGAPPATTLQQLAHAPGIRNALMRDDGTQPAFDANGRQLGFTVHRWFTPGALIELLPESPAGQISIVATYANLIPNGKYTLLVVHFNGVPPGFSPLDGTVIAANWFTAGADGSAGAEFTAPGPFTHATILELIYHSDRSPEERGLIRADMGIDAHIQAIARLR
jgi:hypothetical protein